MHESRYYQMLVLCSTGIAALLGLSDKIPHPLLPYIITPLYFVTARVAFGNWLMQQFCSAFLFEWCEKRQPCLSFEGTYKNLFKKGNNDKQLFMKLRRLIGHSTRDFAILNFITVCASSYFSISTLQVWIRSLDYRLIGLYILPLLLMHTLTIMLQVKVTKRSTEQLACEIKEYIDTANNALHKDCYR